MLVALTWCVRAGPLAAQPMAALYDEGPVVLPRVPEDEAVRRRLAACSDTFEGRRNRALVALLADSGLRISEALRLRVEDINFGTRTITVRQGTGGKDGIGFFGAETPSRVGPGSPISSVPSYRCHDRIMSPIRRIALNAAISGRCQNCFAAHRCRQ